MNVDAHHANPYLILFDMNKPQLRLPLDEFSPNRIWRPTPLGEQAATRGLVKVGTGPGRSRSGGSLDLFSGSGTVSAALASSRDVIAVDIQEYSRVLCSAVLNPRALAVGQVQTFFDCVREKVAKNFAAAAHLIEYEKACLVQARRGVAEPICELIEHGSLVALQAGGATVTVSWGGRTTGRTLSVGGKQ